MAKEGISLGSVTVTVVPVAKGIDKSLRDQLEPAAAAAGDEAGRAMGERISAQVEDAVPAGFEKGGKKAETAAARAGDETGQAIGDKVSAQVEDAVPEGVTKGGKKAKAPAARTGDEVGRTIGDGIRKPVEDSIPDGVTKGGKKAAPPAKKSGEDTGNAFAAGASPLILGAIVTAGAFGAGALLGGMSLAVAGIAVRIAKSNADIQAEYHTLAYDVGREMTDAVQPIVPAVQTAMVQADNSIRDLAPTLKQTFTDVAPDIVTAESGIAGMASTALPGLDTAINRSRGIVSGFFGELPQLGAGAGQFFTGLTTNAQSTQRGLVDLVDVASHALGTLGQVAGSASATLSTDFAAVTPVLDGALTAIDKIANPSTVGALIGVFGAMKFDPAISTGLQKVSNGLVTVAAKADGAGGLIGKAGGAAASAAGGFGKMADIMGGPWGIAIGAGVGLLGGLVSNLTQAQYSASDFSAAVAQDNGVVGANTTKIIQDKLKGIGDLTSAQKDLGVSEATLIEYAAGEKDAQDKVHAAYTKKIAALQAAGHVSAQNTQATVQGNIAAKAESDRLHDVLDKIDQMHTAIKQALKDQNDQNNNYLAATKSAGIFAAMVETETTALQAKAQAQAINTVAALQFAGSQTQLSQDLSNTLYNYQLTAAGAQGYNAVLTALNGTTNSLLATEAGFTIALDGVSKAAKANGLSLDVNDAKGAQNIQTFTGLASSAQKAAVALYQNEMSTKGANQAYDDANAKLEQEKLAFEAAAEKAGFNKQQVQQLADQLFKLPKDIPINADTTPARQALTHLLNDINSAAGTIQIQATPGHVGGKALGANARGGYVRAGDISVVGEEGTEIVEFGASGRVIPHNQVAAYIAAMSARLRGVAASVGMHLAPFALPGIGTPAAAAPALASGAGRTLPPGVTSALGSSGVRQPVPAAQLAALGAQTGAQPGRSTTLYVYPPTATAEQTAAEVLRRLDHAGIS